MAEQIGARQLGDFLAEVFRNISTKDERGEVRLRPAGSIASIWLLLAALAVASRGSALRKDMLQGGLSRAMPKQLRCGCYRASRALNQLHTKMQPRAGGRPTFGCRLMPRYHARRWR